MPVEEVQEVHEEVAHEEEAALEEVEVEVALALEVNIQF